MGLSFVPRSRDRDVIRDPGRWNMSKFLFDECAPRLFMSSELGFERDFECIHGKDSAKCSRGRQNIGRYE